jgi:tetratricopeptide (TPR) repeat protein
MVIHSRFLHAFTSTGQYASLALIIAVVGFAAGSAAQQTPRRAHTSRPSAPAEPALREAQTLVQQGLLDQAQEKVQELLKLNPASVEGYNLLGIIYSSAKDSANAVEAFQQALRLDPNSARTRINLGNFYLSENKLDLAEKEFRTVLGLAPRNRDANYNLALLLMTKGSPARAIPYFQRVRPQNVETRLNLVRACLQARRTAEALRTASEVSARNKDDLQLHFTLGVLLASEKQYKAAQLELEKANALRPETFEILYNLGQAYLRGGEKAKAELYLDRALKLKPDSPEALYLLAQVYSDQARPVDALDLLVRAHKLAPKDTDIIFLMARLSMTQNYFEDAIPLLESGLNMAPQRADLHAALGESYFMSGRTEKAIDEFKKLIDLESSARSYAFMGLAYRHLGRFDEARKYFDEGLKKDPGSVSCLFNAGYIEERQGNYGRAQELFQQALRSNPDFAEALLELANLRIKDKQFSEAAELLKRYVKLSRDPASGYYKLAMVERSLHQPEAAQRDLKVFQTLSKDSPTGPYPYQHLFDYLDNRSTLSPQQRTQLDVAELTEQIQKHPGQPQDLYLLAETYLKLGKMEEAQKSISQLDQISADDYRTQTGLGVLLARYRLYDEAIQHFQRALRDNPDSDDLKFDLADAYFRKGSYGQALETAGKVSAFGQKDDAYLALVGDIYAHLEDHGKAVEIFHDAINRNPDNDQYYLSLALVELRDGDLSGAEQTLQKGLARIPSSGKIVWGLGIISVLQGETVKAADRLERAVDLLPEWAGSYSTLGVFYYQTGQIDKAREVLNRFKGSNAGGLDVSRIEAALSQAPADLSLSGQPMSLAARRQLLELALSIADRTL